jgi:hypothetical protein
VRLWHWQLLGLSVFLAPLAVTGTAAAISGGHTEFVVLPAILYIVLVVRLVRRASSAATHTPRPQRENTPVDGPSAPDEAAAPAPPATRSGVG